MLSLREPRFLLLLLPLVLLAVLFGPALGGRASSVWRCAVVVTLRCAALVLLIVAMAQPVTPLTSRQLPAVFIVDTSSSIQSVARADEQSWLKTAGEAASKDTTLQVVRFGAAPTLSTIQASAAGEWPRQGPASEPPGNGTDLAAALQLGLGAAPDGARVVLLSDGQETTGDAQSAAAQAMARHIAIDTVAVPQSAAADAAVTRLAVPDTVHAGDTLGLQLTVWSNRTTTALLKVGLDGRPVGQQVVHLSPGESPLLVNLPTPEVGWHSVRASIGMAGDSVAQNDALDAVTQVLAVPRVLVVAQDPAGSAIVPLLRRLGFVVQPATPGQFPRTLTELGRYDAVLLDDLPAPSLTARQVATLDLAVRSQGIGLFVLGGPHSLTLGHYSQTPLERMLPVLADTPSSLQQGNVALQLVLDRSGSMDDLAGDVPKITMSRAAAAIALDFAVQHQDQLGLVSFDIDPHLLVPLQKVDATNSARVRGVIGGMNADGGTNIFLGLRMGLAQVAPSTAPYKHIILMTDGRSEPASYELLLNQLQREHVTLSTVGLGPDADVDLLRYLAARGKGRFYYTTNAADLPRIFAEEARLSAGSARVEGTIPVALGSSSPVTRGLGAALPPPIHGYVATVLKRQGQADLLTRAANYSGDPVLAQWQYGLGRVLVWTPGSSSGWNATWLTAQQTLWNDAVRWLLRGPALATLAPRVGTGAEANRLVIDTQQNVGTFRDLLHLEGTIRPPDGHNRQLSFEQTSTGRYKAALPDAGPGVYRVQVGAPSGGVASAEGLLAVPYGGEYLPRSPNSALLAQLATLTGGRVLHEPRDLLGPSERHAGEESGEYWWALVAVALLLFFVDIVIRLSDWGSSRERAAARGDTHTVTS